MMNTPIKFLYIFSFLLASMSCATSALGADNTWVGGDGTWETASNWSGGTVPMIPDDVIIAGAVAVTSTGAANAALSLNNSASVNINSGLLDILDTATNGGDIVVNAGTFEANFFSNNADGSVLASGADSTVSTVLVLDNAGAVTVGDAAALVAPDFSNTGDVVVNSGGSINAAVMLSDVAGTIALSGEGSTFDVLGHVTNSGELGVENGGQFSASSLINNRLVNISEAQFSLDSINNTNGSVFDAAGPSTDVMVTGNLLNHGAFSARDGATATFLSIGNEQQLVIDTGADIHTTSITNGAPAEITVNGSGSQLQLTDNLQSAGAIEVSASGALVAKSIGNTGELDVSASGTIETESIYNAAGGTTRVTGGGTAVNLSNNFENAGVLRVSNDAQIDAASVMNTGSTEISTSASLMSTSYVNTNTATTDVQGSGTTLDVDGVLQNFGTLTVTDAGLAQAKSFVQLGGLTHIDAATIGSSDTGVEILGGNLEGVGDVAGDLIIGSAGAVLPGLPSDPTATISVDGALQLDGTYFVDIAATPSDAYDRIVATGSVLLGGTLSVQLLNGFEPVVGDFFDIALGSDVMGLFAATDLPVFDGRTFDVVIGSDFARLTVTAVPLPASLIFLATGVLCLLRRSLCNLKASV